MRTYTGSGRIMHDMYIYMYINKDTPHHTKNNMSIVNCHRFRRPDANFVIKTVRVSDVILTREPEQSVTVALECGTEYHLPPNTSQTTVGQIKSHIHKPVVMLWDTETLQIHMLFLGQCIFLVFTRMIWTREHNLDPGRISMAPSKPPQAPEPINCRTLLDKSNTIYAGVLHHCDTLDDDDQLQASVPDDNQGAPIELQNKSGLLLMPHNMSMNMRIEIANVLHERPVPVIFDQYGRVYYALLNGCTHLVTMPYWTQMGQAVAVTKVTGISRATTPDTLDTLQTPYMVGGDVLFLPKMPDAFHQEWQPNESGGNYTIRHTSDNKVMSITRRHPMDEDEIEEEVTDEELRRRGQLETDIDMSRWWDTRYNV